MRLGIVTGEYYPRRGGVGDFTRELSLALCRSGHEVHVIAPMVSVSEDRFLLASCFFLHPVIRRWSFSSLCQIRTLARELKLEVLNLQYQALAYGMTLPIHFLPRVAGVPIVVTFHDLLVPFLFPKAGPLRRGVVNMLARSAAGVIVTNAEDEQTLRSLPRPVRRSRGGQSPPARASQPGRAVSNLSLIPIGSNFRVSPPPDYDRQQWRAALGLRPDELLVGFFGFLNPSKGGETLLTAMEILVKRGLPVRLSLIGGSDHSPLRRRSSAGEGRGPGVGVNQVLPPLDPRSRLGDRVLLTGYLDSPQVSAHLLACDVLALPYSSGATFRSGSFLAGLLHGCAIVITEPVVPIPELEDGENVLFVPRENPQATADAIERLLASPDLRAQLSQGARQLARKFDWDDIAGRTAMFFETVISTHRTPRGFSDAGGLEQ